MARKQNHVEEDAPACMGGKLWLTIQETADLLQVSRDTVERWIQTSQLRAADLSAAPHGGRYRPSWRVPHEALEEFLTSRFNKASQPAAQRPRPRRADSLIEFIK